MPVYIRNENNEVIYANAPMSELINNEPENKDAYFDKDNQLTLADLFQS